MEVNPFACSRIAEKGFLVFGEAFGEGGRRGTGAGLARRDDVH